MRFVGTVALTPELRRIASLPRERWEERADLEDLTLGLTRELRRPGGSMVLYPHQAIALESIGLRKSLVGNIPVGEGKTLITFLAPLMRDDAKRVLLLVPKSLLEKTLRDFQKLFVHWRDPTEGRHYQILNYELLSKRPTFFDDFSPDLIIADEGHEIARMTAARSRRLFSYLLAHPECGFVDLSGTLILASLLDLHAPLMLALGIDAMPLPKSFSEAATWARAIDLNPELRYNPGALGFLEGTPGRVDVSTARRIVERRIHETPGVLKVTSVGVDSSIRLRTFDPKLPIKLSDVIAHVITTRTDPEGDEITAGQLYQHVKTLHCGFWYRLEPRPPPRWYFARREFDRFVADILDRDLPGLDTPGEIKRAIRRGQIQDHGLLEAWERENKAHPHKQVAVWLDDVQPARLVKSYKETLVWVGYTALGTKLEEHGYPFFHERGLSKDRTYIEDAPHGITAIASIKSNYKGRNLQYLWHRNLILNLPVAGAITQQLIGRTHRTGQKAGHVDVDVMLGHPLLHSQFHRAMGSAKHFEELSGTRHKLRLADQV